MRKKSFEWFVIFCKSETIKKKKKVIKTRQHLTAVNQEKVNNPSHV